MTEQDWIILRLLQASISGYMKMSPHGRRDFTKAAVYITSRLSNDELVGACDQLAEERKQYETN